MACFKSTHLLIGEYFKNTMKHRKLSLSNTLWVTFECMFNA